MERALSVGTFILLAAVSMVIVASNGDYYLLSEHNRPFHERYEQLRPSGFESHGLGIVGSALILAGVALYSSRKRIRRLRYWGKASVILQIHIALCSLGALLILFHSTFKFGGLAGISFWSMAIVVLSGVVGRYIYQQIPKGIQGNDLTKRELDEQISGLAGQLQQRYQLSRSAIDSFDALVRPPKDPARMSLGRSLGYLMVDDIVRTRKIRQWARANLESMARPEMRQLTTLLERRLTLLRRRTFLDRLQYYFHYWHLMHLPFTIIMLIAFLVHVGVTVAFGYTWIW